MSELVVTAPALSFELGIRCHTQSASGFRVPCHCFSWCLLVINGKAFMYLNVLLEILVISCDLGRLGTCSWASYLS